MPQVTTYALWLSEIARLTQTSPSDPGLLALLPGATDYAELRCYRDLQLQRNVTRDSSTTLTANSPNFTAPSAFIVVQSLNFITPVATQPDAGTRNPVRIVNKEFLDVIWPTRAPQATPNNVPKYAAPITDLTFVFAPTPDAAYVVEVIGTERPAPLTAANPSTVLTTLVPDLFVAASMIFLSGWQRNFSSAGDEPSMAVNWEQQYKVLLDGCKGEELMKAFASAGWTAQQPVPGAMAPRG